MEHDSDAGDIYQPLMVWWALESKVGQDASEVLELFEDKSVWQKSLARQHLLNSRLIRRFAKAGTADLISGARLFELAPDADAARILMGGFEQAYGALDGGVTESPDGGNGQAWRRIGCTGTPAW